MRQDADEVVGRDEPVEHVHEGTLDDVRTGAGRVKRVQQDDEDAAVRIGGRRERLPLCVGIAAHDIRWIRLDPNELDRLDGLWNAVLEDLEIVPRQALHDPAIPVWVDVDEYQVRRVPEYSSLAVRGLRQTDRRQAGEDGEKPAGADRTE